MYVCVAYSLCEREINGKWIFLLFYFMILYADERNAVEIMVQPHKNKIIIKSTFIWRFASSLVVCLAQTICLLSYRQPYMLSAILFRIFFFLCVDVVVVAAVVVIVAVSIFRSRFSHNSMSSFSFTHLTSFEKKWKKTKKKSNENREREIFKLCLLCLNANACLWL